MRSDRNIDQRHGGTLALYLFPFVAHASYLVSGMV